MLHAKTHVLGLSAESLSVDLKCCQPCFRGTLIYQKANSCFLEEEMLKFECCYLRSKNTDPIFLNVFYVIISLQDVEVLLDGVKMAFKGDKTAKIWIVFAYWNKKKNSKVTFKFLLADKSPNFSAKYILR